MNPRLIFSLIAGMVLALASLAADATRIDQLIRQLGSDQFAERESASQELEKIGLPALEPLKKAAAQHPDIETRRRAMELVAKLEKRLESSRLLAPTKVSFDYQDTPLADAVADLAKKSGQPIVLGGDKTKLADRKLTAKADLLDFWPALDRFCKEGGLAEASSIPVPLNRPAPIPVQRPAAISDQIVLVDGTPQELPTAYHNAARVRGLAAEAGFAKDQIGCQLGVALESGISINKIIGVRVDKAVDEKGEALEYVAGDAAVGNPAFIGNVRGQAQGLLTTSGQHQVPVRFKSADARMLRELAGTLALEVRARPEALMTIDNVMKAAGQTAKGKTAGAMTLQDVEKQDDGTYRLRVELQPPAENNPNNVGVMQIQIQQIQVIQIGVGGRIQPINSGGDIGLALLDANGQRFDLAGIPSRRTRIDQNGVSHEYQLLFRPREGMGEPAQLTYSNRRLAIVEIPFTLHNVPLR